MADDGAEITEWHRLGQARIGAGASRAVLDRWRHVSPTDLQPGSEAWLQQSLALVRTYRGQSRALSADYVRLLRAFRTGSTLPPLQPEPGSVRSEVTLGELRHNFASRAGRPAGVHSDDAVRVTVDDSFDWPEEDQERDERRATVSLVVTGPVRAQRAVTGLQEAPGRGRLDDTDFLADLGQVMQNAGASAAAAADREALMGGRDLLHASSRADRKVIGWARVTDSDPCAFCALLASRGAVYRSLWTARYRGRTGRRGNPASLPEGWEDMAPNELAQAEVEEGLDRYHDNCHCTIVPVYSRTDWLPEASRGFRELYDESTRGLSGAQARAAFRDAIEARRARARSRGVAVR